MTDNKVEEKVLEKLEEVLEETKLNVQPKAVIETKNIRTELEAGRIAHLISPEGQEFHIRQDRVARFKRLNKVDSSWIVK